MININEFYDTVNRIFSDVDKRTEAEIKFNLDRILNQPTSLPYANDIGAADNYRVNIPDTTLAAGLIFEVKIANKNTGASTLNFNLYPTKDLVDSDLNALQEGMLQTDSIYLISYNIQEDKYQLLGLAKPTPILPPIENMVFVSKNGHDQIADGSIANPFLTVQAGINYAYNTYIVPLQGQPSSPFTRPVVFIAPGTYESEGYELYPHISIMGSGYNHVRLVGPWSLAGGDSAPWANYNPPSGFPPNGGDGPTGVANDTRSTFYGVGLFGAIDFDFGAVQSNEGKLYANFVRFASTVNIKAKITNPVSNSQIFNSCEFLDVVTLEGIATEFINCVQLGGSLILNQSLSSSADNTIATRGGSFGAITVNSANALYPIYTCDFGHSVQKSSILTLNGNRSIVKADINAIPLLAFQSYIGGALSTQMTCINEIPSGGLSSITVGKTIFVDSVYGNNATALQYRQDKPYADIITAQNSASVGDTILVRPGAYTGSNIGKNGVRYHFENGAVHTAGSFNFRDFGVNSFVVTGFGRFISASGTNVFCTGTGNKVHIEGLSMETGGNYNVRSSAGNTEIIINMSEYITMNGNEQCFRIDEYAKLYVNANIITGKGGILQADGYQDSLVIIKANKISYEPLVTSPGQGYVGFNLSNGYVEIHGDIYANGVGAYGTPVFWLDNWNSDFHSFNFYGNIYSTCTDPLMWITLDQGVSNFYGKINKVSAIIVNGGKVYFNNDIVSNQVGVAVIQHYSGKTIIGALVKNLNASSTSHGVEVNGAGLVLKQSCVIYITDNNANSVYAAAAQNIKVYQAVSNKNVNVNISQLGFSLGVSTDIDSE